MASLEEAYSIEYEDVVNPELAYDLFWAGVINDKSGFLCPSELCSAKVTCINIDKEKQDMQQSPHFRGYNHSEECDATLESNESRAIIDGNEGTQAKVIKADEVPDTFYLKRPTNQFAKNNSSSDSKVLNKKSRIYNERRVGESEVRSGSEYYSVRSLVTKFIRYKKLDVLSEYKINISGNDISYGSMFKGIYNQPIDLLPKENLIYWGAAYINHLKDKKCYQIKFCEHLTYKEKKLRPSFFIHEDFIKKYPVRNLVIKRLKNILESDNHKAFVFLYSKPYVTEKDGQQYINFKLESLDHFEIRYLSLFEELSS